MTFWLPEPSADNPHKYHYHAPDHARVGPEEQPFIMGGVSMGCTISALEMATGQSLLWAHGQFLSAARPDVPLIIDLELPEKGKSITQASAILRDGDRIILKLTGGLGGREGYPLHQFHPMPDVPQPMDCPIKQADVYYRDDNLIGFFEKRLAHEDDHDGTEHLWFKPAEDVPVTAGYLAILADFLGGSHRLTRTCTSLDNLVRIHSLKPTKWVLNETKITAMANGAFCGDRRLFAEDGTLLASASQTALLPRRSQGGEIKPRA